MDPLNVKQALRALVANTPREPAPVNEPERDPIKRLGNKIQADIVKEAPPGLLQRAGSTAVSGLSILGNLGDVPGSMARDVLTWLPGGPKPANPFDQLLSPFSEKNRTTGRDLNRGYGLSGKEDTMLNFIGGMATEILTDPIAYLTFGAGALTKGGRAAKAAGLMDDAPVVASKLLKRNVGKREARHIVTPRMLLENVHPTQRAEKLDQLRTLGMEDADLDKQLGGMLRINKPFSDKPFRKFDDTPFTFGGLTDESGVVGAGKIKMRRNPLPPGLGPAASLLPPSPSGLTPPSVTPPTAPSRPTQQSLPPSPNPPSSQKPPTAAPTTPTQLDQFDKSFVDGITNDQFEVQDSLDVVTSQKPSADLKYFNDVLTNSYKQKTIDRKKFEFGQQRLADHYAKLFPVQWNQLPEGNVLDIDIPDIGKARARIDDKSTLIISDVSRSPKLAGSGKALLTKIRDTAPPQNFTNIFMPIDDKRSLAAFTEVFGKDNLLLMKDGSTPYASVDDAMKAAGKEPVFVFKAKQPVSQTPSTTVVKSAADSTQPLVNTPTTTSTVKTAEPNSNRIENAYFRNGDDYKIIVIQDSPQYSLAKTADGYVITQNQRNDDGSLGIRWIEHDFNPSDFDYAKEIYDQLVKQADSAKTLVNTPTTISTVKTAEATTSPTIPTDDFSLTNKKPETKINKVIANDIELNKKKLVDEVNRKAGASEAEITELILRGDTSSAIRRIIDNPLKRLKLDVLMGAIKKHGIMPADEADDIFAKINTGLKRESVKQELSSLGGDTGDIVDGLLSNDPVTSLRAMIYARNLPHTRITDIADQLASSGVLDDYNRKLINVEAETADILKKQYSSNEIKKIDTNTLQNAEQKEKLLEEIQLKAKAKADEMTSRRDSAIALSKVDQLEGASQFLDKLKQTQTPLGEALVLRKRDMLALERVGDKRQAVRDLIKKKHELTMELYQKRFEYANELAKKNKIDLNKIDSIQGSPLTTGFFDDVDRAFIKEKGNDAELLFKNLGNETEEDFYTRTKKAEGRSSDGMTLFSQANRPNPPYQYGSSVDIDWKKLDPLPEDAKKIVGNMVSKLDERFLDGITLRYGGQGPDAGAMARIDLTNGLIDIFDNSIKAGRVTEDTVHEMWHHLSRYFTDEEVRSVSDEYQRSLAAFAAKSPNEPLPYHLTSIDEYVGKTMADLSIKYLGKPKPEGFLGTAWGKMLEVFEYLWDTALKTLGYNKTKSIMTDFLSGKRLPQRLSDNSLASRVDDAFDTKLQSRLDNQTKSPAFKKWFGDWEKDPKNASKVVDAEGKPLVMYHGTRRPGFVEFRKDMPSDKVNRRSVISLTPDKNFARMYADGDEGIYELYVNARNVADFRNPGHVEKRLNWSRKKIEEWLRSGELDAKAWGIDTEEGLQRRLQKELEKERAAIESGHWVKWENEDFLRNSGFDGAWVKESPYDYSWKDQPINLAVLDSNQIKSATGNRGTFDPTSRNILESQVNFSRVNTPPSPVPQPPPTPTNLTSREIAQQLSDFGSAKIGYAFDNLFKTLSESAPGRQINALFDQSVLGSLTKVGQRIARLAFGEYKDSVFRMRRDIAPIIRTWVGLDKINEEVIAAKELAPLDDYIRQHGNKAKAESMRMKDARVIRNQRYNGLLRLAERPMLENRPNPVTGVDEKAYVPITPQDVAQEAPWVDASKVDEVTEMINKFRYFNLQMIEREDLHGLMTRFLNRYFPRLRSPLPGASDSPWNPNYGEILDPTHPHQRSRDTALDGYTDGTAVVNDISVDPEFSAVFTKRNIKEDQSSQQIALEIENLARNMWSKYGDRLDSSLTGTRFSSLPRATQDKIKKLARKMAFLDAGHVDNAIPLFSADMVSSMMQRLEHSYRASAHANVIRDLVAEGVLHKSFYHTGDAKATNLKVALKEGDYGSPMAVARVIRHLKRKAKDVIYDADKRIWDVEIEPKIRGINAFINQGQIGQLNPTAYNQNYDMVSIKIADADDSVGINEYDFRFIYDRNDATNTAKHYYEIVEKKPDLNGQFTYEVKPQENPNATPKAQYTSNMPPQFHLQALTIPREVADEIKRFVKPPRLLGELLPLVRYSDKFTNVWKMMQTGMLPFIAFHTRNLGSGQASNLFTGIQSDPRFKLDITDPTSYLNPFKSFFVPITEAHTVATGDTLKGASDIPDFKSKRLNDEQATEKLRQELFALGLTGERQGLSAEQLQESVDAISSQYPGILGPESVNPLRLKFSKPVAGSTFSQRYLQPWMMKGGMAQQDIFRPGQLGKDIAGYTESLNRIAPYIAMRRQGFDPREAARLVNEAQVDYTALSNFNRDYTRRLFPFAAYTLGITPMVAKNLTQRPGGLMGRTVMATTQAGQGDDQGVTPDYIRETASIPLGLSEDGTRSYITGFGLPFEDPLQFAQILKGNVSGTLRELGSRMNPIPKALIEATTGESLYQSGPFGGREIEDLDPTIGRIKANIKDLMTGSKTEQATPIMNSPWLEYAIANSGLGRSLNTVRTATDPRKWDTIPWKLLLNLGTGVRVADVSPSAQDAILRERLARVMKDFGGRMYTRPFFPDYAKEDWTPQEAEDAAKIEAIMTLLNQRSAERKKMREAAAQ